jgi:hypothetical protein
MATESVTDHARGKPVTALQRELRRTSRVITESARMSSAAEARFRIEVPQPTARAITVIPLDPGSERLVATLAERVWSGVTFRPSSTTADQLRDVLATDLVVMVATAGTDAGSAAIIGEACSRQRIPTATCVIRGASASDAALSRTLAQVRPWSLMVVIAGDHDYVEDFLRSFR